MNSISIVSTPMQMLNCLEGVGLYGCSQNDLIICASSQKRLSQMKTTYSKIGASNCFHKLYEFAPSFNSVYSSITEKVFLCKRAKTKPIDIIFIGNYKLVQHRYFLYKLQKKNPDLKIVLVDDGLAICDTARRRIKELKTKVAAVELQSRLLSIVYMSGNKMSTFVPKSIEYNSAYEQIEISGSDTFKKNTYSKIKKIASRDVDLTQDGIFNLLILGQPMVQMGYLTKELHTSYILDIVKKAGLKLSETLYIPHPTEKLESSLTKELLDNLEVCHLELPVELYSLFLPDNMVIAGFYTSALLSIHQLRPEIKIVSRCFNEISDFKDQKEREILEDAYSYIENSGIEVIR